MAARTGSRRCNSSARTRPPASSAAAVAPRRRPSPTTTNSDTACGKARKAAARRRDAEVSRKMEALRRLVPSGRGGDEVDELLLRAAGYIARLQAQVTVMQLMVDVLEHTRDY
ncbi:hypothetical protein C2845_PM05G12750 [Panicum miliaceum]|uniref:BHLH domain-containing protein n=1 Tax=Panicum miliaceum TaxID=4540 RepID=A0A3L6SZ01_PANMI|nr:hypothetical protein C2845_PM05G12750 [Panicum miliaceum]